MFRTLWPRAWRLLLAISLATGPLPPLAAAAGAAPDPAVASDTAPCHRDAASLSAPSDSEPDDGCPDGCCADPACDAARCLMMHTVALASEIPAPLAGRPVESLHATEEAPPRGPPPTTELRPPIA